MLRPAIIERRHGTCSKIREIQISDQMYPDAACEVTKDLDPSGETGRAKKVTDNNY